MSHLQDAKKLIDEFPQETSGFSLIEVRDIWEEYSENSAASWLMPTRKEVMWTFRKYVTG